jgi:hypothetical protein
MTKQAIKIRRVDEASHHDDGVFATIGPDSRVRRSGEHGSVGNV